MEEAVPERAGRQDVETSMPSTAGPVAEPERPAGGREASVLGPPEPRHPRKRRLKLPSPLPRGSS